MYAAPEVVFWSVVLSLPRVPGVNSQEIEPMSPFAAATVVSMLTTSAQARFAPAAPRVLLPMPDWTRRPVGWLEEPTPLSAA